MPTDIPLAKKSEVESKAADPHGNEAHGPDFVTNANFGLSEVLSNGNVDGGNGMFFENSSAVFENSNSDGQVVVSKTGINGTIGSSQTAAYLNIGGFTDQLVPPEKSSTTDVSQGLVFNESNNRLVYRYDDTTSTASDAPSEPTLSKNTL